MLRVCLMFLLATFWGSLRAHTVPVIVIEAEFDSTRAAVLKVNLDPRLFLHAEPTTLPPVPASWWLEQDDSSREKTREQTIDYLKRTLAFTVGQTPVSPDWSIQAIDSASAFPLGQASAEAHLLAEARLALPSVPGGFQVSVAKDCAVAVILLCSNAGDENRRPEPLIPGESSRAFALPALPPPPSPSLWEKVLPVRLILHHLLLAVFLGWSLHRKPLRATALLAVFTVISALTSLAYHYEWLPEAPPWMPFGYGLVMISLVLQILLHKPGVVHLYLAMTMAGFSHGVCWPPKAPTGTLTGLHFGAVVIVLLVGILLHRAVERRPEAVMPVAL